MRNLKPTELAAILRPILYQYDVYCDNIVTCIAVTGTENTHIAMYELGISLDKNKRLILGTDPILNRCKLQALASYITERTYGN